MPNRQLLLLRHAKAAIGEGLADIDRPLAGRGERASKAIGRYMAENGLAPDLAPGKSSHPNSPGPRPA